MNFKQLTFTIFICFTASLAIAQSGTWTFYNTSNSGLPSNYVRAIVQENDSVYWIGTNAGVAKFDGSNWTIFNTTNSGLPNNDVRSIVLDAGDVWFATVGGGIAKFDGVNWTVYNESNSGLPHDNVLCLTMDVNGNLWAGTTGSSFDPNSGGAAMFDKVNSWTVYNMANSGISNRNVRYINVSDLNNIWFGTMAGLSHLSGSSWTVYDTSNSILPREDIRDIKYDSLGNIWVGTTGGLGYFDGSNWTIYDTSNAFAWTFGVITVFIDQCGHVWNGSYYLHNFDGLSWTVYDTANSPLHDYNILLVTEDNKSNIWVGSAFNGIAMFVNDCSLLGADNMESSDVQPHIYPNPMVNSAIISFNNPKKDNYTLTLYDMRGRLQRTFLDITTGKVEILREGMKSGLYFFKLRSDQGSQASGKIIIE